MMDLGERGFEFAVASLALTKKLSISAEHRFLINQFLRAACSIGANITEGRAGSSRKEMARYYQISLKSSRETIYWLKLIKTVSEKKHPELEDLLAEVLEITRILSKSVISLKSEMAKEQETIYQTSSN
jgi:four helix bundle protein